MVEASKMNRRIIWEVRDSEFTDDGGGSGDTILETFDQWAFIEDRTGRNFTGQATESWAYTHKITCRKQRTLQSQYTFLYEGYRFKVESIEVQKEGYKEAYIIRATKTDIFVEDVS